MKTIDEASRAYARALTMRESRLASVQRLRDSIEKERLDLADEETIVKATREELMMCIASHGDR